MGGLRTRRRGINPELIVCGADGVAEAQPLEQLGAAFQSHDALGDGFSGFVQRQLPPGARGVVDGRGGEASPQRPSAPTSPAARLRGPESLVRSPADIRE